MFGTSQACVLVVAVGGRLPLNPMRSPSLLHFGGVKTNTHQNLGFMKKDRHVANVRPDTSVYSLYIVECCTEDRQECGL